MSKKGRVVFSGVLFSRLKRGKTKNGEKMVTFDLLICGKKSYSVIRVVTTGGLARRAEYAYLASGSPPFVNAEGQLKSGARKIHGKKQNVVFLMADKVDFVMKPRLIPYKVV